jgi:hypothetical protein
MNATLSICLPLSMAAMSMSASARAPVQVEGACQIEVILEGKKAKITCLQGTCQGKCSSVTVNPTPEGGVAYSCPCE